MKSINFHPRIFTGSWVGLVIIFVAIFSLITGPFANAATWDNRGSRQGYFRNVAGGSNSPYPSTKGPVLPNNDYSVDSIPASVNSTAALYQFLNNKYNHTGPYGGTNAAYVGVPRAQAWDRTGVSFIVNSMLGRNGAQANRVITNADWADLQQRLAAVTFSIQLRNTGSYGCLNTFYQYGNDDVAYYPDCNEQRLAITLYSGAQEVYVIFYSCANPIGNFTGLPRVNFNLTPSVTVNPLIIEAGGGTATVSPVISNGNAATPPLQWQVTTFEIPPKLPVPTGATNTTMPVTYYGNGATILTSGAQSFPKGLTNLLANNPQNIKDHLVGTRICYALSVQQVLGAPITWDHSPPACITIAKKPKVQVLGGDLMVGRPTVYNPGKVSNVVTSTSLSMTTNLYYGSWSEYAIIPSGTVKNMASGAVYAGGTAANNLCALSVLTIANNTGAGCQSGLLGKYVSGSVAPNIEKYFTVNNSIGGNSVDIKNLTSGQIYSVNNPTLNISSSVPIGTDAAGRGKWVVIDDPEAVVTITSNINYSPQNYGSIYSIPQVVIIAKNIIIDPSVTQVDAWLIAAGKGVNGFINTCGSVVPTLPTSATLNSTLCDKPLTINGPILANHLYMYRTANGSGIGPDLGVPAETFNLRSDAYLWASTLLNSGVSGRLTTITTKELPPRF
jgi:hypothetical protein